MPTPTPPGLAEAFRRGGALGAAMAQLDWSRSPLGEPAHWPPALQSCVGQLLASHAQIVLFWGPELCALYNDAYAPTIGDKHPSALGRPAREGWAELWDDLGPLLEGVLSSGEAFGARDRPFFIERRGFLERVWFDVSYDPVRDTAGEVAGVFCIVTETTRRVLGERRLRTQRELADRLRGLDEQGACQATTDLLVTGEDDGDAVAAQVHLVGRRGMRRAAASGPDAGGAPAALEAVLGGAVAELPARELLADPPAAASETALALPMPAGGRVLGALVVTPSRHLAADEGLRGHLRDAAERLARTIADVREQEEARRRDGLERAVAARQRHVATVLQRAILPDRLPEVPGLQLAAGYRPGDAALEVGGDWYDAFEPRPGRLALAVGDVMGRGVEAAASMAQLRNGLRAYLAEHDGPGAALDHLRGLADGLGIDFCTVACVEVDLAAGRVRTALAGHPPPLLLTADGGVAWLDGVRSAPIGSGPAPPTPEVTTPLPPGATALLYTDGLVERRDRSLEDGLAALADAAIAGRGAGAGELVSALLDGLAGADDDTALVAVRRDG